MPYCKKEEKSLFRKAMILVVLTLGVLGAFLAADRFMPSHYSVFASDLGLTEENCRCCHDTGVPDRHHLLIETNNYTCLECHPTVWDEASSSLLPLVIRDCLVCHVGSLADRHHIANQDCFACHEAVWDPDTQSYFITFANGCAPTSTLENCSDGVDNDSNGQIDCNDAYCAGTVTCMPDTIEICNDDIDNNGDTLADCDDPACVGSPLCQPPEPEDCNDDIDNDVNGQTDCGDPACVDDPACVVPPVEICDDGIDNDGDQWVDCNDSDCYGNGACVVNTIEICTDAIDNDGNGLIDCEDPDCVGTVDCPDPSPTPTSHFLLHQSPSSDCTACHLTNLHDQHNKNCNYCHQNPDINIQQAVAAGNTNCTGCHSATTHTMGCANCHKGPKNYQIDTVHVRHMDRVACGVCHEIPVTVNLEPTGQYCITCHSVARPYTHAEVPDLHRIHVTGRGNFPYACNMCHGQNIPQIRPEECSACHSDNRLYNPVDLPTIHVTHSRLFDCTNCHFDPRIFALDDQATGCLRCHEMRPYNSTLEVHSLHIGQSCWTCHTSNGVTARAGHTCASCHNGTTPTYNKLSTDIHKPHSVGAAPCWTCHGQLVPVFPTLQLATASPSGTIIGTVTDLQGASIDHVNVYMPECGHSNLTVADGTYQMDYISPGSYTVNTSKPGYQNASQTVDVSIGYTSTVDFALTPLANTGAVSGVVLDGQGIPVPGVRVATADMLYSAITVVDGSYSIAPIVEGSYQLTAVLYGYVDQTKSVTVATWQSTSADFTVVQIGPELCFDGFDNDDDGQIDCADQDCSNDCTGMDEICGDGIDNDFDGYIDCFDQDCNSVCNGCTDIDNDGYYIDGGVCGVIDCNDANGAVHPGVTEICDGIDNNCDGAVDEGLTTRYYLDSDGDGFGKPTVYSDACSQPVGYVLDNTDCNDTSGAAYPGGTEVCDGLDNNCDGFVDEGLTSTFYLDGDGDGFGSAASDIEACSDSVPAGYVADASDCNDNNALVNPSMTETCNGVDDNCDTQVDEGVMSTFYLDSDGDTFGDGASPTQACSTPVGYVGDSTDCNDASAAINPAAAEVCDGIDNNCDSQIDEGVTTTYYRDNDGDTYGDAGNTTQACSAPAGYVGDSADCNDSAAAINPGAAEVCDGIDNNCNGQTDEGVILTYYRDSDGDTYGDAAVTIQAGCSPPVGYVGNSSDCNDANGAINPGAVENCSDGIDNDCNGLTDANDGPCQVTCTDADNDGFSIEGDTCGPVDCNDANGAINPGAAEICDTIDNNCDGQTDEGVTSTFYLDNDSDGYGDPANPTQTCSQPAGYVTDSTDCNDSAAAINPGSAEVLGDGLDNNCDGLTDCEDPAFVNDPLCSSSSCNSHEDEAACSADPGCEWFVKKGRGSCRQGSGGGNCTDADNDGFAIEGGSCGPVDCNDANGAINPGVSEICDGIDNNCDGQTDEGLTSTFYLDNDGDTFGDNANPTQACSQPVGYVTDSSDCNDGNALIHPNATEICDDGLDNNCNGQTDTADAACPVTCTDADGDGFSIEGATCGPVDCNDANGAINPGASEICDGIDNNCDGQTDEGLTSTFYLDNDGDTFGDNANPTQACSQPAGYVTDNTDCNDANGAINPGAAEICDTIDNNCDGQTDEGLTTTFYLDSDNDSYGDAGNPTQACSQPAGYVTDSTDCNDASAAAYPGASEICDGIDNNCDGQTDEGLTSTFYLDNDGDTFGDNANPTQACSQPAGYVTDNTDCDDHDNSVNPAASEILGDGLDNNCNGLTDCDDPAFTDDPLCNLQPEICDDSIDNDGDTKVDCDDNDCNQDPACGTSQEICDDGIDNDGDGNTDCADNQCQTDPYCQTSVNCQDITEEQECLDAGCDWSSKKGKCN